MPKGRWPFLELTCRCVGNGTQEMVFLKQLQFMFWLIVDPHPTPTPDQMLLPLNEPPFSALVSVKSAFKQGFPNWWGINLPPTPISSTQIDG